MKNNKYNIKIRIPKEILNSIKEDLKRPHSFAYERVGFLFTKSKRLKNNTILILGVDYSPIPDLDYIEDHKVGAKINADAIRMAMQSILDRKCGCFHVHLHEINGMPSPSFTDNNGIKGVLDSFSNISRTQLNGMLILSEDSLYASLKIPAEIKMFLPKLITIIGYPMEFVFPQLDSKLKNDIFKRQSFLGENNQFLFDNLTVGIVGYGGGGSHIGQQLAHLGIRNFNVFDDDNVEDSNLNRLLGAWFIDVKKSSLKINIAKRVINKIRPNAKVNAISARWQTDPESIQNCDVVFGCVDSYTERQQLESECRRYLIPYIDIGMDVHKINNTSYSMSGQVILSMPGSPCMHCFGFLTEEKLAKEASKYGDVGGRPQVVWPNGVLASTAIGVFVDLATGWSKQKDNLVYLAYDGNLGTLNPHIRIKYAAKTCTHFLLKNTGPQTFIKI